MDDQLNALVLRALEKEIVRNTPAAKAKRAYQSSQREFKRGALRRRRSLAAEHGAKMRVLKKKQAEDTEVLRRRREAAEAESEQRRWEFLIRHG